MATRERVLGTGLASILPGIALALGSTRADGFLQGLLAGAGIALILIGAYLLGTELRRHAGHLEGQDADDSAHPAPGLWLPSRDEDPGRKGRTW